MFKALKRGASDREDSHHPTVIGKSAVIVGNLVSQDQVQLNGHVVGNIDVNGSPHAQLSVMPQGHVEGDINARQASVNGVVTGNIASDGRVELHAGADVKGNISYATVAIEHGAKLYGIMSSKDAEQL